MTLVNGLIDEWSGNSDPGIVDQTRQGLTLQTISNDSSSLPNCLLVSDIEEQWGKSLSPFGAEPISVFPLANTAKDMKPMLDQDFGGSPPNARGNAGDHNRWHDKSLLKMNRGGTGYADPLNTLVQEQVYDEDIRRVPSSYTVYIFHFSLSRAIPGSYALSSQN